MTDSTTHGSLADEPLPTDRVGLIEGLTTTRAIRRYRQDPIPPADLRAILFATTRAPSGSNRQPFRFLVLTDGPNARQVKSWLGERARQMWSEKRIKDGYDVGSGADVSSPKGRMDRTMQAYAQDFEKVPVVVFPILVRYREPTPIEGASIFPACQNLLLAARALGYGGVITGLHGQVEPQIRALLGVPEPAWMAATITLGRPQGSQGAPRRRPMRELVFEDAWGAAPDWAVDPPGTRFASAGPPTRSTDGTVAPPRAE
jgi:nitroreductase